MKKLENYSKEEYNYGIDLLRLLSMYMVVILHVLGQGGILAVSGKDFSKNSIAWLIEICAYCAVDCYAIISGYVCYSDADKKYNYKKVFGFWVQVFTYSFGITFISFLIKPDVIGLHSLIYSMFPITSKSYWYVSAYVALFFIIPWINKLLRSCSKNETFRFVFVIVSVFIIYITFANKFGDCFSLEGGYSFAWLMILYVIGAWMKKCNIPKYLKNSKLILGSIVCVLFTWFIKMFTYGNPISDLFVNYTSITIVFVAFSLVAIFSKIQLDNIWKKIVLCFAPAAFGVYLIHVQSIIWNHFMLNAFAWIVDLPCWQIPIMVFLSAFCILACCLVIEKIRLILFAVLRINKLVGLIEDMIGKIGYKMYLRIIYWKKI